MINRYFQSIKNVVDSNKIFYKLATSDVLWKK